MSEGISIVAGFKTLAVISVTKAEYIAHIEKDLIPILEGYHGVKFLRNHADDSFNADGMKIIRVRKANDLRGLGNYQLVKVGKYYNHPELEEIEELYSLEVRRRLEK